MVERGLPDAAEQPLQPGYQPYVLWQAEAPRTTTPRIGNQILGLQC